VAKYPSVADVPVPPDLLVRLTPDKWQLPRTLKASTGSTKRKRNSRFKGISAAPGMRLGF
jgi:hypothetical protein